MLLRRISWALLASRGWERTLKSTVRVEKKQINRRRPFHPLKWRLPSLISVLSAHHSISLYIFMDMGKDRSINKEDTDAPATSPVTNTIVEQPTVSPYFVQANVTNSTSQEDGKHFFGLKKRKWYPPQEGELEFFCGLKAGSFEQCLNAQM